MSDMLFNEMIVVLCDGNIQTLVGYQAALIKGILIRVPQSHEFIIPLKCWKRQLCDPTHCCQRGFTSPLELLSKRQKCLFCRDFIEATDTHIDRVYLSPSQKGNDSVPCLFHLETALDNIRIILRQTYNIGIAQKVGGMEHIDMQRVAFNPLAAVEQSAQGAKLPVNHHAKGVFHRVYRAHLIRDRADSADTSGDIWSLAELTPAHKCLKETWRFDDFQFDIHNFFTAHFHVERTLTLNTGKIVNFDGFILQALHSPYEMVQHRH